jgi:heme-degrading monooxygenase HmoA
MRLGRNSRKPKIDFWRAFPAFVRFTSSVIKEMKDMPGLRGHALKTYPFRREFLPISGWENSEAIRRFVPCPSHRAAMKWMAHGKPDAASVRIGQSVTTNNGRNGYATSCNSVLFFGNPSALVKYAGWKSVNGRESTGSSLGEHPRFQPGRSHCRAFAGAQ